MEGSVASAEAACLREVRALERSVNGLGWVDERGGCCCGCCLGVLVVFFLRSGEPLVVCNVLPNTLSSENWAMLVGVDSSPEPSSSPPPKGAGFRRAGADLDGPAFLRPKEKPGLLMVFVAVVYETIGGTGTWLIAAQRNV
jgi:hypothetical protein